MQSKHRCSMQWCEGYDDTSLHRTVSSPPLYADLGAFRSEGFKHRVVCYMGHQLIDWAQGWLSGFGTDSDGHCGRGRGRGTDRIAKLRLKSLGGVGCTMEDRNCIPSINQDEENLSDPARRTQIQRAFLVTAL